MSFSTQNEIPIDAKLYKAAVEGRFQDFEPYADSLDCLLSSKKDTILHLHLNYDGERSTEFVKRVFEKCPQLLRQTNENGDTPLHIAARNNHPKMARLLIQLAFELDLEARQNPEAAVAEARKMIRMVNKDKDTALHEAVQWNSTGVVKVILGAEDLEFKYGVNNYGETPLYLAASCRSILSLRAMLDAYKHRPVAYEGPNGKTVLHAAIICCSYSKDTICELIEKMGSLVKQADENGWTPLHYAVCERTSYTSVFVSKILEMDRSTAYMKDKDRKRTALHIAACLGNTVAMNGIISMCPECAELTDYRGWNVCHFASIAKSFQVLELVLEDPSLAHLRKRKDTNGYTPIDLCYFLNYATNESSRWSFQPHDEISEKKGEILKWIEELGNGPLGKLVPGELVPPRVKSWDEINKEREEEIMPELEKAKDSHLVAAALVATVTFAAAFTLPGGYISDENKSNNSKMGSPILSRNAAFKAFVITDSLALVLSTCSVFVHFMMVIIGYKEKYAGLIFSAFWLIILAMGAMIVAFVAGTYAVLAPNSIGLAVPTCLIGLSFFPFVIYTFKRVIN